MEAERPVAQAETVRFGPKVQSLGGYLAARAVLHPVPGWVLGSGQLDTPSRYLRRIVWRQFRRPFRVEWLEGLRINLYPGNESSRSIFVSGFYDPNELSLLARILRPGMTFIDVGANMGLYSLFGARKVGASGKVVAIEPSRREAGIIREHIEGNGLGNVTLLAVAVTDREGEAELLVASLAKSGHNTLGAFGFDTALDHRERVRSVRLDDVVREQSLTRVDVIKMDIEGAEELALRGAERTLRDHRPLLLMELSHRSLQHQQSSAERLLELLGEFGYSVYGFEPESGLPSREPRRCSEENVIAVAREQTPPWV